MSRATARAAGLPGEARTAAGGGLSLWYFYDKPLPNGFAAAIQILRTGAAFAAAGDRFVCLCGRPAAPEAEILRAYGIASRPEFAIRPLFPSRRVPRRLRAALLRRALRRKVAEIAETPGRHALICRGAEGLAILPVLGPLARAAGLPVVHEMHCLNHLRVAEQRAGRSLASDELPAEALAARDRERAATREADALVFLTPEVEAAARAALALDAPGIVLPSGTEAPRPAAPAGRPRHDLVYAGKLEARKGVRELCAAMRHLPNRTLAIAGGPPEAARELAGWLRDEALADRVTLVGFLPPAEVPAFLAGGRVGACPSTVGVDAVADRFGSPLKLLQMMGAGMPIVASDVAPVRALVRDGIEALLAPPGDPPAFAASVGRLLADPALGARLGAAARLAAKGRSWENRAAALRGFLARVTSGGGGLQE